MLSKPTCNAAQQMADKFSVKEFVEFERFCHNNTLWNEMKKIIAFVMSAIVALTLTACSASENTNTPDTTITSSTLAEPSSSEQSSTESATSVSDKETLPATSKVTVWSFDSTSPQGWSATFQVISSDKGNILIDPGKYDNEVADYIKSIGGIETILITHGHWDKLRGLDEALVANPCRSDENE